MPFDFDEIIPRKGTNCIKHDFARERGLPADVLPLWVADMDFRTPPAVVEALVETAKHGIFGYSDVKDDYFEAVRDWFARRFSFEPKREWLKKTPGVVCALNAAVRAFTKPGDAVIIQSPVYYPFFSAVRDNGRTLVDNPLVYRDGAYSIDFRDLDEKARSSGAKLFLFCSPHNPVGRVWTRDETKELGKILKKRDCLIFSDEIHCDFVWGKNVHGIFNGVNPDQNDLTILATSPSKTFNLAGLMISNVFIPNPKLKKAFSDELSRAGLSQLCVMGLNACKAAYLRGEPWLIELKAYLENNLSFSRNFVLERLPGVFPVETQGTYLLWLDFGKLGKTREQLNDLIINKAKLWLDEGLIFGEAGRNFQRINVACPKSVLEEAFLRLERALKENP
ncbi:MAG: pyridoxal phosphate-dependent aminotransferase [Deltaproteobacteria bacterium]|jgi:cystathionine beta-lyase|nr:pyridoxal phosphate-dependent aminotransferase [Deltaproteobacteria bacterium]